jgi:hypothetical protein
MLFRRISSTLTATATLAFAATLLSAQTAPKLGSEQLQGSFTVTVSLDGVPGEFKGFVTYSSDGTAVANEIVAFAPPLDSATFTEDHGGWVSLGDGRFAVTFIKFACIRQSFVASVRSRAIVESDDKGFHGRFRLDILDPSGQVLFTGTGNIQGERIVVDLAPSL